VALERTTLEALSLQKLQDLATDLPYVATATRQVRIALHLMRTSSLFVLSGYKVLRRSLRASRVTLEEPSQAKQLMQP